jgi:alpha-tubulin suppressor-like RCC1 family protein
MAGCLLAASSSPAEQVLADTERAALLGSFAVRGWGALPLHPQGDPDYRLGQVIEAPVVPESITRDPDSGVVRVRLPLISGVGGEPGIPGEWEAPLPDASRLVVEANHEALAQGFLAARETVAIACGEFHTLLLKRDGTVRAEGWNGAGQTSVPPGLTGVLSVAAGFDHSLAVLASGQAVAWGRNDHGQCTLPNPANHDVVAAAGGLYHSLLLRRDGTVITLNPAFDPEGFLGRPITHAVSVAAGVFHSLALTSGREVITWGPAPAAVLQVPAAATNIVAIAAGGHFSLALRGDGQVIAWGDGRYGQLNLPPDTRDVVAIAAGSFHALALRRNGQVLAWGENSYSQAWVPDDLTRVVAVAAGGYHNQVLQQTLPPLTSPRLDSTVFLADLHLPAGQAYHLEASDDLILWQSVSFGVARPGAWTIQLPRTEATLRFHRLQPDFFPSGLQSSQP